MPLAPVQVREWVVASWLMANRGLSAVFMCCIQCYGSYLPFPEYSFEIGSAAGNRYFVPAGAARATTGHHADGYWRRDFSSGAIALLHPVGSAPVVVELPAGVAYEDADSRVYTGRLTMNSTTGAGHVLRPQQTTNRLQQSA